MELYGSVYGLARLRQHSSHHCLAFSRQHGDSRLVQLRRISVRLRHQLQQRRVQQAVGIIGPHAQSEKGKQRHLLLINRQLLIIVALVALCVVERPHQRNRAGVLMLR